MIEWLKTATDLQVWFAFVGFTWVFAGLAAVHMVRHNLGRHASKFEEKNNDPS